MRTNSLVAEIVANAYDTTKHMRTVSKHKYQSVILKLIILLFFFEFKIRKCT